ncbi:MAG TPA: hypothetical protein VF601_03345 [Beijerinckiaceae bacterium]|jgi:hypothetical protein
MHGRRGLRQPEHEGNLNPKPRRRGACESSSHPDGLATRADAELLLRLDRAVASAHPSWTGFLVAAVVDFTVWSTRPTARIDEDTALWLAAALAGGGAPTRRGHRIVAEILAEAEGCHPALTAFALTGSAPADGYVGPCGERLAA